MYLDSEKKREFLKSTVRGSPTPVQQKVKLHCLLTELVI